MYREKDIRLNTNYKTRYKILYKNAKTVSINWTVYALDSEPFFTRKSSALE